VHQEMSCMQAERRFFRLIRCAHASWPCEVLACPDILVLFHTLGES
jgi:hypothetical protein